MLDLQTYCPVCRSVESFEVQAKLYDEYLCKCLKCKLAFFLNASEGQWSGLIDHYDTDLDGFEWCVNGARDQEELEFETEADDIPF